MTRLFAIAALLLGVLLPPLAAAEPNPQVLIKTNAGDIRLELFPGESPLTVANFLAYVDSGHYVGTIFHRVIPNFMIQGGGFTADMIEKPKGEPVANESRNHLHNERGTIAMARTEDPDSATSQFFINVRSNLRLDFDYVTRKPGYTVFGRVIEGMDVVDGIALVETGTTASYADVPRNPIIIEKAERIE
jgi:cyclophilin family peptidyl-prolyl cis-trans isomerase